MDNELFFSELQFMIIFIIATLVSYEFYLSKDGILRKIMIWFFISEAFVYLGSGVYYWAHEVGFTNMGLPLFRTLILLPKTALMLRLLHYLTNKR